MKDAGLDKTPDFYRSATNDPRIERMHSGARVGSTVLNVLEVIHATKTIENKGDIISFPHSQKRRCDLFGKYREQGNAGWTMIPTLIELGGDPAQVRYVYVYDVTKNEVQIEFNEVVTNPVEFVLYLIDFSI